MYSCYPGGAETYNDTNLVFTVYDEAFDFASERTYYLVDSVIYVDSTAAHSSIIDNAILNEIAAQFNSIGYTRAMTINDPSDVNIVVMAALLKNSIEGISYYPGYGGWYGGYWGYWGYPGYYPGGYYPVPYSYDVGSIFIDAFDGQNLDPDSSVLPHIVWTVAINGLLNSNTATNTSRIKTTIDQAFEQSPYL
jgi:hypothetical protein